MEKNEGSDLFAADAGELPPPADAAADHPLLRVVPPADEGTEYEVLAVDEPELGLFMPDELFVTQSLNNYRKPVAAIHSVPEKRDASLKLSSRKLMEALPLAVQLDLRSRRKDDAQELVRKIREDRATPLFEIRTKELARLAGIAVSNMDRIHEMLAELVGFKFIWNVLGEDGKAAYESVAAFLIRRDKGVGGRRGYTRFAFEPEILLWFLEPQMWASLSWTVMSSLGGHGNGPGQEAAFGLYQNIWRYITTHAKLTPAHDTATWIDFILGPSRFVQVDAAGKKTVVDYKDFKRRYLLPGLAILNSHPALNHTAEVSEEFSGRRVARLRFHFKEKRQASFDLPLGWPPATLKQLEEIGFKEKDIVTLSQLYPYDQVTEALKRLPGAEQRTRAAGSRVYSRKAFFNGILVNVAKGEAQTAEDEAKLLKEAEKRQIEEDEAQRMRALTEKFRTHQRGLMLTALQALPEAERTALFEEHIAADPSARVLFKGANPGGGYLTAFTTWVTKAKPDLVDAWLVEPKDKTLQSWLAWRVLSVE